SFARLGALKEKIQVASEYFVDEATFSPRTLPSNRPLRIGYIGRLSPEKGVANLLDSLAILLPNIPEYEFVLGGSGPLLDRALDTARVVGGNFKILGWIPASRVARELSEMRLVIIPSYT